MKFDEVFTGRAYKAGAGVFSATGLSPETYLIEVARTGYVPDARPIGWTEHHERQLREWTAEQVQSVTKEQTR